MQSTSLSTVTTCIYVLDETKGVGLFLLASFPVGETDTGVGYAKAPAHAGSVRTVERHRVVSRALLSLYGCHEINETLVCGRNAVLFEGRNERGRLYRRRVGNRVHTAHFIRKAFRTNCSDVIVWITGRSTSRTWTVISCSLKLPRNFRTGWIPLQWKTASS